MPPSVFTWRVLPSWDFASKICIAPYTATLNLETNVATQGMCISVHYREALEYYLISKKREALTQAATDKPQKHGARGCIL